MTTKRTWTGHPEQSRGDRAGAKLRKLLTDKMSADKTPRPKTVPVNRPTKVRAWWLVDVRETRTLRVLASGPKHARDIAAMSVTNLYPPESYNGEPHIVKSFAHTVQADEGRSTRDQR